MIGESKRVEKVNYRTFSFERPFASNDFSPCGGGVRQSQLVQVELLVGVVGGAAFAAFAGAFTFSKSSSSPEASGPTLYGRAVEEEEAAEPVGVGGAFLSSSIIA